MFDDLSAAERTELRISLQRAIASGHMSVTYSSGGTSRTVQYRSLAEMESVLQMLGPPKSFADRAQTAATHRGTE